MSLSLDSSDDYSWLDSDSAFWAGILHKCYCIPTSISQQKAHDVDFFHNW